MTELTTFHNYLDEEDLEILSLKQKFRLAEFENKERIIQLQCQIEVYKNRSEEYKSRYQQSMNSNGNQEVANLLKQLKSKENQILDMRSKQLQNKNKLVLRYKDIQFKSNQKLQNQMDQVIQQNRNLIQTIEQIKNRAVQTLIQKQNIINSLTQKLESTNKVEQSLQYLQLKDQYDSLIQKHQFVVKQYDLKLQMYKVQNIELSESILKDSQAYEQKLIKLQYDLQERMNNNIKQVLSTFQTNENNLLNDLQNLQSTIQKFQLKSNQLQIQNQKLKSQIELEKKKSIATIETINKQNNEEMTKAWKLSQDTIKNKQKQIFDLTSTIEKMKSDFRKVTLQEIEERSKFQDRFKSSKRKLSQQNSYSKHEQKSKSFQQQDEVEQYSSKHNTIKYNQLKDFQDNYEWPSIHNANLISEFNADLKQSIQSIQDLNSLSQQHQQVMLQPVTFSNQKSINFSKPRPQIKQQLHQQILKLKTDLQQAFVTIKQLNQKISQLTKQIQNNRQNIIELKKQKQAPKSDKQTQLKTQLQDIKLYLCEVQKQLLSQKWKYCQLLDYLNSEVQLRQKQKAEQMAKFGSKSKRK